MKRNTPPRLAVRMMKWLFPDEERYTTLGDLEEVFHYIRSTEGAGRARMWYWRQLLSSLGPYVSDAIIKNGELMFRNYLRVAARGLRRRPGYTFINVMGLAVGLACCLLIFLFVRHERAFDQFHEKEDRIYRMATRLDSPTDGEMNSGRSPLPHAPLVAEALPEIEAYARLFSVPESFVLSRGEDRYSEPGLLFADAAALEIFSFPLKRGDPATALDAPFTAVLTETAAAKYFGNADPIGQTLVANGEHEFTVAGIVEDIPATSHLQFDGLLSIESARQMKMAHFEDRLNLVHATYFLIRPETDPAALQMKMNDVIERAWGEGYRSINLQYTAVLEPLREVYLHSKRRGLGLAGSLENLYIFSVIALFTLAIACINFTNLATARSAERAREVGVRKALGAQRGQLAWQFLGESVLLTILASVLAVGLAWAFLPTFNNLAERSLSLATLGRPELLGLLAGVTLLVGLLAGSYPALVLSRFRPASVLKGALTTPGRGVWLRKGLVVFQFGISVVLICGTGIVYRQLQHMQQQRLGFRTEQMLVLDTQGDADAARQIDAVKRELRHIPGVAGVTASDAVPGKGAWQALSYVQGADDETREMLIRVFQVDARFIGEYDLGVVAGRSFTPDLASDSAVAFIVNEATRRALGYASAEDAVGKAFRQWGRDGEIVGVVEDFHFASLRREVAPLSLAFYPTASRYITVRVATNDLPRILQAVEAEWSRLMPHRPFTYQFLDDAFQAQYRSEQQFGKLVGGFALLALLVACLGLFGLASFTAQQRTKEIGVRKVLGASVPQIVFLLFGQFARLVAVAFVVALPVAYLTMGRWLDDFAYRIDLTDQASFFLLVALTVLSIAFLTVSFQSVRVALSDPVKALRYE